MKAFTHRSNSAPHSRKEMLAAFDRALRKLDRMSKEQFFETLVRAGIYTKGGKLTKPYGG